MWRQIFSRDGLVNQFLGLFGVQGADWIGDPRYAMWTLVVLSAWQFGTPMLIFLAGLKQLPQDLYEAAAIDGAGRFTVFFKITLPLLSPMVFFNLVLETINAFQTFTPAYVISNGLGGPIDSTLLYTLYLYLKGFGSMQMGYASAMAWVFVRRDRALHGRLLLVGTPVGELCRLRRRTATGARTPYCWSCWWR
jgi:multiple sugar transport system permease protein